MSTTTLARCGAALLLAAFISGCAAMHHQRSDRVNQCKQNPNSCQYQGAYEPGERAYAEQEARRLNQAESNKIRGW